MTKQRQKDALLHWEKEIQRAFNYKEMAKQVLLKEKTNSILIKGLGNSYLLDLIAIVKEEAFHGINRSHDYTQSNNDTSSEKGYLEGGYLEGYALAYNRVISIMIQQTAAYNISLSELNLADIDPDKDLLPGV